MRAQLKWVVGLNTFEICVTNADGTHLVQLTDYALFEGTGDVVRRWAESHIPELGGSKSHSALQRRNGAGRGRHRRSSSPQTAILDPFPAHAVFPRAFSLTGRGGANA